MPSAASPPFLTSESLLREHVPEPTARVVAKIRPELEGAGRRWIEAAALVGLATRRPDGFVDVVARAREREAARSPDDRHVRVADAPSARIGDARANLDGNPFAGAIFVLPGLDATLRAHGAARVLPEDGCIELAVAETYMHCPKAFVRSRLWDPAATRPGLADLEPESGPELGPAGRRFVERSPFALLGTCLERGSGDVSPRGDPPGFVRVIDERTLLIPDRPGNRIMDSFRNVLANPVAGLLFLVPGAAWALRATGEARITADAGALAPLAVKGRPPRLGIWLRLHEAVLERAPALAISRLWDPLARVSPNEVPSLGRTLVEQVDSRGRFRGAKGRVLEWMLGQDVKKNLY